MSYNTPLCNPLKPETLNPKLSEASHYKGQDARVVLGSGTLQSQAQGRLCWDNGAATALCVKLIPNPPE